MATRAFQKELLPPPRSFYQAELEKLSRPSRGWAKANCPFHRSKSKTSFSVNIETGNFHCFGCEKHGDIVDFVMLRHGVDFPTACKMLGAWRNVSDDERRRIDLQNAQRRKQKEEESQLQQLTHDELIQSRNEIHTLFAIQAETSTRLSELLSGAAPDYPNEVEHCWSILSLVLDDLRQTETDYMLKADLEHAA